MPDAATSTSASASAYVEPPQPVYVAPSALTMPPELATASPATSAGAPPPTPQEIIERPPPKTLARGRFEVKPATIWLTIAFAALLMLLYVLMRVRQAANRRKRELARLTALPGKRSAST